MPRRLPVSIAAACAAALALILVPATASAKKKRKAVASARVRADEAARAVSYGRRDDVMRFAADVAERQGWDADWVQAALAEARYLPSVARYIMPPPPGTAKNWALYRSRFVEPTRIRAGTDFWSANEAWLKVAEERYGVPPEIIVGILGVETIYGRQMGDFRVIDALATLSFDFPPGRRDRSAFFRDELESLFVLSRRDGIDPLSLKGSYAGAVGMPQFMPSTMTRDAIDFDGDGRVDLHRSSADVIGSVANFLAKAGWLHGLPTIFDVEVPEDAAARAELLAPDIVPQFTAQEFADRGVRLGPAALGIEGKLALIELHNGDAAPSYVAGTTNFYAITRYNWSSYYAMAVIALGEAVKQRLRPEAAPPSVR
jgi:membrane-bound lytic murein transglycosylase B